MCEPHQLPNANLSRFALAGNATFTVRSVKTGTRFTYKVSKCADAESPDLYFVSLLTGEDNENDFQYLGVIRFGIFSRTKKSRIGEDAPSARGFAYVWPFIVKDRVDPKHSFEVFHEGRCGRCGRKLTVPESIESGFGPECSTLVGIN